MYGEFIKNTLIEGLPYGAQIQGAVTGDNNQIVFITVEEGVSPLVIAWKVNTFGELIDKKVLDSSVSGLDVF